MLSIKSLKTDPLGIVDTRLMMTNSPDDSFFSPFFSPFTGLDGTANKPGSQTEPGASSKRAHRIIKLRESFRGFDTNRKCPRLELDVAVDKYHSLDGLAEPLNPQNTPASNSERGSTEESTESLHCYKLENMRGSSSSQPEEFNFDRFQDSPDPSFAHPEDGCESPKNSKLRHFALSGRHCIKSAVTDLTNHQQASHSNILKNSDSSVLRSVRFSPPVASLSPPSRAMRRPLPSVERRQDYIALYRQKNQYQKWKISRSKLRKRSPCNSPMKIAPSLAAHIPNNHNVRVPSLSSLPCREPHQTPLSTRAGPSDSALGVRATNVADTPVTDGSDVAGNAKYKIPDFIAVSCSLYRIRSVSDSSLKKASRYSFQFRISQTVLPQHPSPHVPTTLEHSACQPVIEGLLFHTCFIIPALIVMIPATILLITTALLTETRVGAVMVHLFCAPFCLVMNLIELALDKCGVSCSCQWNPDTCHSD